MTTRLSRPIPTLTVSRRGALSNYVPDHQGVAYADAVVVEWGAQTGMSKTASATSVIQPASFVTRSSTASADASILLRKQSYAEASAYIITTLKSKTAVPNAIIFPTPPTMISSGLLCYHSVTQLGALTSFYDGPGALDHKFYDSSGNGNDLTFTRDAIDGNIKDPMAAWGRETGSFYVHAGNHYPTIGTITKTPQDGMERAWSWSGVTAGTVGLWFSQYTNEQSGWASSIDLFAATDQSGAWSHTAHPPDMTHRLFIYGWQGLPEPTLMPDYHYQNRIGFSLRTLTGTVTLVSQPPASFPDYSTVQNETMVVATWENNGEAKLYVNGVLHASASIGVVADYANWVSWGIGNGYAIYSTVPPYTGPIYQFGIEGSVDGMHIYNRALSAAEVLANYNSTTGSYYHRL